MRKPYQPIEHRLSTDYYFVIGNLFNIYYTFIINHISVILGIRKELILCNLILIIWASVLVH